MCFWFGYVVFFVVVVIEEGVYLLVYDVVNVDWCVFGIECCVEFCEVVFVWLVEWNWDVGVVYILFG